MKNQTSRQSVSNNENFGHRASNISAFAQTSLKNIATACVQKFSELKERIAAQLSSEYSAVNAQLVRQAVQEAVSLAASTSYPALLLPALAEEKVRSASAWQWRQQSLREPVLAFVA